MSPQPLSLSSSNGWPGRVRACGGWYESEPSSTSGTLIAPAWNAPAALLAPPPPGDGASSGTTPSMTAMGSGFAGPPLARAPVGGTLGAGDTAPPLVGGAPWLAVLVDGGGTEALPAPPGAAAPAEPPPAAPDSAPGAAALNQPARARAPMLAAMA